MRIFIVAHTIRGGGAETYLRGLLPVLTNMMQNVSFKMTIPSSRSKFYKSISSNLVLEEIPDSDLDKTINRLLFDNYKIVDIVSDFNPDLIFSASEVVTPKLYRFKKPVVLVYHSTLQFYMKPDFANSKLKLWYTRFMRDRAAKKASMIISVSHYERAEVGMRYHNKRYENSAVIYHGVDHKTFCPKKELEIVDKMFDFPYIICVSDYHEHKKMDEMLNIYYQMVQRGIKEHLVIIGRVKNKRLDDFLNQIEILGLSERVHLIEYIDNSLLRNVYVCSNLYWTNSNAESFGITPLEAMACRVPVFAPWRESLPEVYGNSACFYNTFIDSQEEIALKCVELLFSEELLEKYAEEGFKHSLCFSWTRAAKEYKKIFENLLLNY